MMKYSGFQQLVTQSHKSCQCRLLALTLFFVPCYVIALMTTPAQAVVQFQKVFASEYLKTHEDTDFAKFAKRKARCFVCHQGKGNKYLNAYGAELGKLLDAHTDKKDVEKITKAIQEVDKLPFNSADSKSPTFGERIADSKLPAGDLEDLKKFPTTSLFDGKTLKGWTGSMESYMAKDGAISSTPGAGGNLYTEGEYANFVLYFDFKLTPGANNGIGIRAPLEGDAAYQGIEIQVLDNSAEKYADLEPYQFHGSAYGVAAAKKKYQKPVGEWNSQEIHVDGSRIKVVLNTKVILDIDLDEVAPDGKTVDDHDHPGLKRKTGHIGFLGHGDVVSYRNIQIYEIPKKKKKGGH